MAKGAVPNNRKVNGKVLTEDINITSQDIFSGQAISIPDKADLNDYQTPGLYYQGLNAQAGSGNNYPEPFAGSLVVLQAAGIIQRYFVYNSSRIYTRSLYSWNNPDTVWTPWAQEYNTLNKPTALDIQSEPRYTTTIDLTGLSTERYYPVWWSFPPNVGANSWLTLHRPYPYDAEKKPFGEGVTHVAGLLAQIEGGDIPWGGDAHYLNIKRINQTYRKTIKTIRHAMISVARPVDGKYPLYGDVKSGDIVDCYVYSGCYLRGGLTYFTTSNFQSIHYSREDGESEIYRWSSEDLKREMKWMVKSLVINDPLLGEEYTDNTIPYSLEYDTRYQKKS
ncbi:pyocin knob domain-containing protein [Photorhabdus luminescens]|uniref:pyocin knob domain-containing protein n=1 Tax=Photorhabdus luminescens TaxID=29488 RepID=UPI00159EBF72|nr:pyocin knob domain-containing protein [Photorhabdus luminescens]